MTIFVDTNVLLDVLAFRVPFYTASARVWSLAERGEVRAYISAISFNNIYYVVRKAESRKKADYALRLLRDIFLVVAPDTKIVNQAIDSELADFEDAVQFHSAIRIGASCLVTRNADHFPKAGLSILTPEEFLAVRAERMRGGC